MKRIFTLLTAVVLVLTCMIVPVSAEVETMPSTLILRGQNMFITNKSVVKSTPGSTNYCVNLTTCSVPGLPGNLVGSNYLVFRPYSNNDNIIANSVNFYGTQCTESGNRRYGSWISAAQNNSYRLKGSLGNSSISSYMYFSLRWNP